jgi:hypothetical protein
VCVYVANRPIRIPEEVKQIYYIVSSYVIEQLEDLGAWLMYCADNSSTSLS